MSKNSAPQAAASTAWQDGDTDTELSDTDLAKSLSLPKIVGIGLKAVFDIIRYKVLCFLSSFVGICCKITKK